MIPITKAGTVPYEITNKEHWLRMQSEPEPRLLDDDTDPRLLTIIAEDDKPEGPNV